MRHQRHTFFLTLFRTVLFYSASLLLSVMMESVSLAFSPESREQFFLVPNEEGILRFTVPGEYSDQPIRYEILDSAGRHDAELSSPGEVVPQNSRVAIPIRLPQGFWEIRFPASGRRFGLVSLPAASDVRDPFFSIDAALSWLVQDDQVREDLVKIARRVGISMIRERIRWKTVEPEENQWSFETDDRYDSLRNMFKEHGIEVLEFLYETPEWMEKNGLYPADLLRTTRSWETAIRHWNSTWGAVEIWNEPDIEFFGGNLPADQYVPLPYPTHGGSARKQRLSAAVNGRGGEPETLFHRRRNESNEEKPAR